MNPDDFCAKLEAFHDGELPPAEARAVAAHINTCPCCREELSHLRAMEVILKPCVTTSNISVAVMARIAVLDSVGVYHTPAFAGWWKVPVLALASCAVYALCVETGLLPVSQSPLLAAVAAHKEAEKLSIMIFGGGETGSEQLLAMLLEGGKK
ncbi:MAG: zf-HC2 domain-containing protein [Elusimicrobia bacterium]|nr:zf-HC2 domain-containing protein [Elusimicrobiota bacterium]